MEILRERIAQQIGKRGFCLVFNAELESYWPSEKSDDAERKTAIEAFAKSHGWNASIFDGDSGTRAIFRRQ